MQSPPGFHATVNLATILESIDPWNLLKVEDKANWPRQPGENWFRAAIGRSTAKQSRSAISLVFSGFPDSEKQPFLLIPC